MNKLSVFLFLWLFSVPVFSPWGIKGGWNISNLDGYNNVTKPMVSFHLGGTYDYQLSKNWYFQPSLMYTTVGFNLIDDKIVLKGGHVTIHALETPFNFSYRPEITSQTRFLADFGLYARYGLFGNKTYEYHSGTPKVNESPFDAYNRFDLGLNFGVGLQMQQYCGVLSFLRGLSKADKEISVYHQVLRISLGYKF